MEEDFPTQDITIYHKSDKNTWDRYIKEASYRNTSILNRNKNGENGTDNALIRIFDIKDYNSKWFVNSGDIMVNKEIDATVEGSTPITQLSKKYGKDNVHKVTSIDKFILDDEDLPNHIKIGAI